MAEINVSDASGKQPRKGGFYANQPSNRNFLEPTGFKLEIPKIPNTTFFCQSVNIPGIAISEVEQQTVFNPVLYPGGKVEHENFTASFIVNENLENWLEVYKWIRSCSTYKNYDDVVPMDKSLVSDAILFILSSKNNLIAKVSFQGLFPKSLSSIDFDYGDTELEALNASVDFAFTSFEVEVS